ncbi:MAG: glycine--tRNA ligase subunit beta [Nitrospiria bacterium]
MSSISSQTVSPSVEHPLLLEIGVEEVPSNIMPLLLKQLLRIAKERLNTATIPFSEPRVFGTPRRLILSFPHIASEQGTKRETIIGPPKRISFDSKGIPTPAAIGFAKSQKVSLEAVQIRQAEDLGQVGAGKKGAYLVVEKRKQGKSTTSLLEQILPEMIAALSSPKSMKWNGTGCAFVRPIRWIVALYDEKVIPFSYAGVSSGNVSYGHHLMSPGPFHVSNFKDYQAALRQRFVLVDPDERCRVIETEMKHLADEKGGRLGGADQKLIWEAVHTVEFPKAICGTFDASFLEIPEKIIITAMTEHQGYFHLVSPEEALLPYFITIANIKTNNMAKIIKGNERVLTARLYDARFYFEQDRKKKLLEGLPLLKNVTFQDQLGSLYEKVERLVSLSSFIAKELGLSQERTQAVERAARLCKCDLLTGVVREFTSLQGKMGCIYALLDGENALVAEAIETHYLPRFSGDDLPKERIAQILALADKLDTICGCFGVGLIPSGSEDPYALRRQGLGVIQMIAMEEGLHPLSLRKILRESFRLYEVQKKFEAGNVADVVSDFLKQRLDYYLNSVSVRYDLRDAVLTKHFDRPADLIARVNALVRFSKEPDFDPLMLACKRAMRILPEGFEGYVNPSLFTHESEKALYEVVSEVERLMDPLWKNRQYVQILETLASFYAPLSRFFEDVLVMDKEDKIRHNRLSLLFEVSRHFDRFSDFQKIVEGEFKY